jgi:hypothetical protein
MARVPDSGTGVAPHTSRCAAPDCDEGEVCHADRPLALANTVG